jgi:2-methylcitrate dehydratase PrpD
MNSQLTQSLAEFIAQISYAQIPGEGIEIVSKGFADCTATMIAGSLEPGVRAVEQFSDLTSGGGDAHLYFSDKLAPAALAACVNGTAAHAIDYDDVALMGHPSAVLVPTILAEAETLDSSGAEIITAYVAGYETWAELVKREQGHFRTKGWHPTGIFGPIAAAAACAALHGADSVVAANTIGIAASQSSGIAANFGSMTKAFHVGRAAFSGIMSYQLAATGMTASADVLEHPQGFLNAISPTSQPDLTSPPTGLGRDWQVTAKGLSIKRYPICYAAHRSVDAMLGLMASSTIAFADIESISASISKAQAGMVRHHEPQTGLEAKFSLEFALAAAVIAGRVGLSELTDTFVARADVQELLRKVIIETHEDYDPDLPDYSWFDQVQVYLKNGDIQTSEQVRRPTGHASNPLDWDTLRVKFDDCLGDHTNPARKQELFEKLRGLEKLVSVRSLYN